MREGGGGGGGGVFARDTAVQEHVDSVVGKLLQCKIERGNVQDRSVPTPEAYSRCTCFAD